MKSKLWRQSYTCLIIANSLITISYGMFSGLLALYVQHLGYDNSMTGSMAAGFGVVLMLSKPITGAIIDRTNRKKFLVISTALFLLNSIGYCFAANIGLLYFLRVFNGLSNGLFIVASSTFIALVVADDRLEDAVSYYRITASVMSASGPVVGTWIYQHFGFPTLFISMSVVVAIAFVFILLVKSSDLPTFEDKTPFSFRQAFGIRNLIEFSALPVCAIGFFTYIASSSNQTYLVSFGQSNGIPNISWFFMASCLFMLLSRFVFKLLSGRISEPLLLTLGISLLIAAYLSIPHITGTAGVLACGAVFGLGDGLTTPQLNAIALRRAPMNRKGAASATFSMVTGIGTSVGADLWGKISAAFGYTLIYIGSSISAALGAGMVWLMLGNKAKNKNVNP